MGEEAGYVRGTGRAASPQSGTGVGQGGVREGAVGSAAVVGPASVKRTIWWDGQAVSVIDQRHLPHRFVTQRWRSVDDVAEGIRVMQVRGAPLIGVAAAHGVALAMAAKATRPGPGRRRGQADGDAADCGQPAQRARTDRPATSGPARWSCAPPPPASSPTGWPTRTPRRAGRSARSGPGSSRDVADRVDRPVEILTHCNAGWLACVEWGTATAPMYIASRAWPRRPRLGQRDPSSQPGRGPDGMGARAAADPPHGRGRQRVRPPVAHRAWWTW